LRVWKQLQLDKLMCSTDISVNSSSPHIHR